ncbi:MAG: hypothetical protein LBL08_03840, partial [Candidatus Nomurabacteria bacterium]|nr:hypothetical protein [Candidatus Nomurabacteria bacterium]
MTNLDVHFLQSEAWRRFQAELGRETIDKDNNIWQYMAIVEHGKLANRLYCPYGPTVVDKVGLQEAIQDLAVEAKTRHLDFVRIEPIGDVT